MAFKKSGIIIIVILILGIISLAVNSCTQTISPTPVLPANYHAGQQIIVMGESDKAGDRITFTGTSNLPPGAYLQSQLYENNKPLAWWPTGPITQVGGDGSWRIFVLFGKNDAPDGLLIGPEYLLNVWASDNASIAGSFPFDLVGPPVP